jgi:hypothetical protein
MPVLPVRRRILHSIEDFGGRVDCGADSFAFVLPAFLGGAIDEGTAFVLPDLSHENRVVGGGSIHGPQLTSDLEKVDPMRTSYLIINEAFPLGNIRALTENDWWEAVARRLKTA